MNKREAERFVSDFATQARIPATRVSVTIVDLSTSGCKLRTESELAQAGSSIVMSFINQLETHGWIVWKSGTECGVQFDNPLPSSLVLELTTGSNPGDWVEDVEFLAAA